MARVFANNKATTLAADLAASGAATTVTIPPNAGFPSVGGGNSYFVTLDSGAGTYEILLVTAHTSDATTMTVQRGMDGTQVVAWSTGDLLEMRVVAEQYREFVAESDENVHLQGNLTVDGDVTLAQAVNVPSGGTGLSSVAAGTVLIGNGTADLVEVAPLTNSSVLASTNGAEWESKDIRDLVYGSPSAPAAGTLVVSGGASAPLTTIANGNAGDALVWTGSSWEPTPPPVPQLGASEIYNGTFELGTLDGWDYTPVSGSTAEVIEFGATEGSRNLVITSVVAADGGGSAVMDRFIAVAGGQMKQFRMEFWAEATNIASRAYVDWYDIEQLAISSTELYTTASTPITTGPATLLIRRVTAPANARFAKVRIELQAGSTAAGAVHFDNIVAEWPHLLGESQEFTTAGSFTFSRVWGDYEVEVVGGGGSGGTFTITPEGEGQGTNYYATGGAGGSAWGPTQQFGSVAVTVGAGGVYQGAASTSSSFGAAFVATGGFGGNTSSFVRSGGLGTSGKFRVSGDSGAVSTAPPTFGPSSRVGNGTYVTLGGPGGGFVQTQDNATYGGGGLFTTYSGFSSSGRAGAAGYVRVQW